jgi:hypothetical protein
MATQINSFYKQHVMQYATFSEDGMVVTLPSERKADVSYNILCKETAHGAEAVSCQCYGFSRYHRCKHITIVNEWLDEQAPATPVEPKITEIEPNAWYVVNSDSQVWRDAETGQWMTAGLTANAIEIVEAHLAVKTAEQIVATPMVEQPAHQVVELTESDEHTTVPVSIAASDTKKLARVLAEQKVDLGLVGNLTRNHGFQMLR